MSTRDEDFVTRLFVANTHTPVLFFSSRGMVYKMKVWRCRWQRRRRAARRWSTCCRWKKGERITTIMPLPEDEDSWAELDVMFATTRARSGATSCRFRQVNRNGKIAMKLDEG
jgi:DNA gyrase subunit A